MNILLLGSGGRESAIAWKIKQSSKVDKLYIAPGNAGTASYGENINIEVSDFPALREFILNQGVDMVIVGPEDPLVKCIYNYFEQDMSALMYLLSGLLKKVQDSKEARNLLKPS